MLHHAKALESCDLQARDASIGAFKDLYFDDHQWAVRYLIAATGSWLNRHHVLISPKAVRRVTLPENAIELDLSKEQVRNSPSAEADKPVSRQHEVELHQYYGWSPYWLGTGPLGAAAAPTAAAIGTAYYSRPSDIGTVGHDREPAGDPHLRSSREVRGYKIECEDGDFGHLEDFLVDDARWSIPYVVVDTRNWLPGRKVVLPSRDVKGISWADRRVFAKVDRAQIERSPEIASSDVLSMNGEQRLADYYQLRGGDQSGIR